MLRAGLKFLIKDALRGARFTMRQASLAPPIDFPGRTELTGAADSLLTSIEETVVGIRYGSDSPDEMVAAALSAFRGLSSPVRGTDYELTFAAAGYRLAKRSLALRGVEAAYLSEFAYGRAAEAVVARAVGLLQSWTPPEFAAEVAIALIAAEPIRAIAETGAGERVDDPFVTDPNRASALSLGLAVAAYLRAEAGVDAVDCLTSAGDLVSAAYDRLSAAHTPELLAPIFAELAAFVP
jgi:hypothetical protein